MRVLAVIHYPTYGGPHNQVAGLDDALRRRGIETVALLPDEPGNAAGRLIDAGVETRTMPLARMRMSRDPALQLAMARRLRSDVARLRGAIRREDADLVLLPGLANPQAALAARLEGVPVVWQIVDTRVPGPARRALMAAVRGLADAVMFWGRALERTHVGDRPLDVPAFIAASPVDPARFAPSVEKRATVRAELGIPAEAPVLGLVGNLNPQKGLEHFVAAAERVARERPDAWFVVAGARMPTHAAYLAQVEAQIDAAGLRERVLVLGERDDVDAVLAALDLLLITSVPASEGIPTVALEAMAAGVPVVTTDVGAAAEAVLDGTTGAVVPPLDPDAIAAAALALLADEPGRAGQGRAGRERVLREFSLDRIAELHATAFGAARDRARARRAPGLAIVQGTIPDYRVPFFALLAGRVGAGFEVWTGAEAFEPTIRTVSPLPPWARLAPGTFLAGRRVLWQRLPVRRLLRAGVVVAELNPRVLSTWALLGARRAAGRRTVLWGHAWPRGGRGSRTDLLRHGQRRLASALVTYSETQRAQLLERMPGAEIHAAPNAVAPAAAMRPADGAEPATDFLYVGRLVPEKKPALLVEAFATAAARLPADRRLVLVGAGPEEERLRALASAAGLGERVALAGHVGDPERLRGFYARAIASVSPGYVGLSITQSLGYGVPMIHADDEPHSPEVEAAVPGFNAVPFRSDSVAGLADALVAVSEAREEWAARRQAIADDCAARYSLEAMADALLAAVDVRPGGTQPPAWTRSAKRS